MVSVNTQQNLKQYNFDFSNIWTCLKFCSFFYKTNPDGCRVHVGSNRSLDGIGRLLIDYVYKVQKSTREVKDSLLG